MSNHEAAAHAYSDTFSDAAAGAVQVVIYSADARHGHALAGSQSGKCIVYDDLAKAIAHASEAEDEQTVLVADLIGAMGDGLEELADCAAFRAPTVLICDVDGEARIPQGVLDAAFFVLRAPAPKATVTCIVDAAKKKAAHAQHAGRHYIALLEALKNAETGKFAFRTMAEAETLARFLAYAFPDRARATRGLTELMRNAVEHGNLEIGFKEKARLIEDGLLDAEIARRLEGPAYSQRVCEAVLARKAEGVYAVITDKGAGFQWSDFTKFSPARAAYKNGRGIQVARLTCFDKLAYNEAGNQVTAFMAIE